MKIICKYCKSTNVIKQGLRKNLFGNIQKYHCKKCDKIFSIHENFRMRYPKKIRELALRLYKEEKLSLRKISGHVYKETHVKVSATTIMSWIKQKNKPCNYRWNKHCKLCNEFIPANEKHICKRSPGKKDGLYHCSKCHRYLTKESFNKDLAKKYGIMCKCKECRRLIKLWKGITNI